MPKLLLIQIFENSNLRQNENLKRQKVSKLNSKKDSVKTFSKKCFGATSIPKSAMLLRGFTFRFTKSEREVSGNNFFNKVETLSDSAQNSEERNVENVCFYEEMKKSNIWIKRSFGI
jgi:hypothetical protein